MTKTDNPCGEVHPLPCGVDKDCGYLDRYVAKDDLRWLVEEWRDNNNPAEAMIRDITDECADELEKLIDE